MFTLNLPEELERRLRAVIQENYDGDIRRAFSTLLALHEKYGWKEQLRKDVAAVRRDVGKHRGSVAQQVREAVEQYRRRDRDE